MRIMISFSDDEFQKVGAGKLHIKGKVHFEGKGEVIALGIGSIDIDLKNIKINDTQDYEESFKEASKPELGTMEARAKAAIRAEDNAIMR